MENSQFLGQHFAKISQKKCDKPSENLLGGENLHLKPINELIITLTPGPIRCLLSQLVQLSQLDQTGKVRTCHLLCRVLLTCCKILTQQLPNMSYIHRTTPNTDRQSSYHTIYYLEEKKHKQLLSSIPPPSLSHAIQKHYFSVCQMTVTVLQCV